MEFGSIEVDQLEESLSSLWFYVITQWLRLSIINPNDTLRSRWDTHPLWELFSVLSWKTLPDRNIRRVTKERIASDDYLFTTGFGAITSYMARENIDSLDKAVSAYLNDAKRYHDSKGRHLKKYFHHYVIEKKSLKSRKYNTLKNETEEQKIDHQKRIEQKAREYKDKSDGE